MSYIVKNCPAYQKELVTMDYKTGETKTIDKNYCINPFYPNTCQDCTDCVIKQVIEKCKYIIDDDICLECNKFERGLDCFECDYDGHREDIMRGISRVSLAKQILQLFDIEEINK